MKKHMKEIRNKGDAELSSELVEARKALRSERFAAAGARPKDPNSPKKLRKQIARILTEQHARAHSA